MGYDCKSPVHRYDIKPLAKGQDPTTLLHQRLDLQGILQHEPILLRPRHIQHRQKETEDSISRMD